MIESAATAAGLELKAPPHMLRHACGDASPTRTRRPGDPRMARPSVDHQHRGLHGAGAEQVQGLLERLGCSDFLHRVGNSPESQSARMALAAGGVPQDPQPAMWDLLICSLCWGCSSAHAWSKTPRKSSTVSGS
jgi:hypothetical protein